ncbi:MULTISPECIES: NADP-dependent oxidoreductase [unclassified Agromyces]|uniref:NADP-dependent oxidoreductase n=1 Tax=unclassified Agromyces TaxID=2639701 RepID=UPI0030146289
MAQFIRYTEHGGPEVLTPVEGPVPEPPPGRVVVEVRAAGVNPVDSKIRSGRRGARDFSRPQGVGADAAGVVVAIGDGVDDVRVGDEVIVHGAAGAYATHLVATPAQLVPKPAEVGFEEGAALGIPAGTAYQVLRSLGLREGEALLLHAGSGGVGQAAIQFARAWGADVVATASPANHARLRELGAVPVAYGPGLVERLREASPRGYDVALDGAGTDEAVEASLELVPDRSRVATIVRMADADDLGIRTWSSAIPSTMGPEEVRLRAEGVAEAARLAAAGRFQVEVSGRYPLAAAADAQRESEAGHVRGKIVLVP